jgi:Fe-S cluster biogenesis protein NfuA
MLQKNDLSLRIEKILDELIRPSLSVDGGDVEVVDVDPEKGIVKIRLTGHCAQCPMSGDTFYGLVEKTLKEKIPEIKAVRQVKWGEYLNQ